MCEIKTVGALRGGQRVGGGWTAKKMCEIKRVGALRCRRRVDYKKCAKLRGSGRGWSAKLRGLGH